MDSFRFRGGRLCLDFVATVGHRGMDAVERLIAPADLARWFAAAGMAPTVPEISAQELEDARALRESLFEVFTAHRLAQEIPASPLATVNAWAVRPARTHRLEIAADGRLRQVNGAATLQTLLAELARDAVDLLGGPLAERVHVCEQDPCSQLFVDTSRAGHRRWCAMETCGARAKMAAYRARRAAPPS
ncbi:CGNR zinc finger domain-containing protein [Streptosporangium sp. KLBMP 9127]|nr:ABATE domain-containing protein [Streptosporangium sp. KLBMP 9127]